MIPDYLFKKREKESPPDSCPHRSIKKVIFALPPDRSGKERAAYEYKCEDCGNFLKPGLTESGWVAYDPGYPRGSKEVKVGFIP
jgi:hypothetical protein